MPITVTIKGTNDTIDFPDGTSPETIERVMSKDKTVLALQHKTVPVAPKPVEKPAAKPKPKAGAKPHMLTTFSELESSANAIVAGSLKPVSRAPLAADPRLGEGKYNATLLRGHQQQAAAHPLTAGPGYLLDLADRASYAGWNRILHPITGAPVQSIAETSPNPVHALAPGLERSTSFPGGLARAGLGMFTGGNVALMGGMGKLASMAGVAPKVLSKILSGYFGAQGARIMANAVQQYHKTGNASYLGEGAAGALMVGGSALHIADLPGRAAKGRAAKARAVEAARELEKIRRVHEAWAGRSIVRVGDTLHVTDYTGKTHIEGRAFNVVKAGDTYTVRSDRGEIFRRTTNADEAQAVAARLNKESEAYVSTEKRYRLPETAKRVPIPARTESAHPYGRSIVRVGDTLHVTDYTGKTHIVPVVKAEPVEAKPEAPKSKSRPRKKPAAAATPLVAEAKPAAVKPPPRPTTPSTAVPPVPEGKSAPEAAAPAAAKRAPVVQATPKPSVRVEPRKAANINLDLLDTGEAVKQHIERTARDMAPQLERQAGSKQTLQEVHRQSHALGINVKDLEKGRPADVSPIAWAGAVRHLLTATSEQVHVAERAYQANPSDENLAALQMAAQRHQVTLLSASANSREAGRLLQSYKAFAEAFEGEGRERYAREIFNPTKETPVPVANPDYGAANKLVTRELAAATRIRLQERLARMNAGIDPGIFRDLTELGLFHLEAGLRAFPPWAAQMTAETGKKISEKDLREVWNGLRREASQRAKAKESPKEAARRILLEEHGADAARIARKLANIQPDDLAGLNRVMREEARIPVSSQLVSYWKTGLLSSPRTINKILLSHGISLVVDDFNSLPSAIVDVLVATKTKQRSVLVSSPGTMMRAGFDAATRGVKESFQIARYGEQGAIQKGMRNIGSTSDALFGSVRTNSRIGQAYMDMVRRAHGADYRLAKVYAYTRAIESLAKLQAAREGAVPGRVKELMDSPPEEMALAAVESAEKAVLLNNNKFTKAIGRFKHGLNPAARATAEFIMPFAKVSSNLFGRIAEYVAGGPLAVYEARRAAASDKGFDLDAQRRFSETFGRNITGMGIMAFGAWAAAHGMAKGFNSSDNRTKNVPEGSIRIGGRWYQVSLLAPVGTIFALGASLYELYEAHLRHNEVFKSAMRTATKVASENPVMRTGEQIGGLTGFQPEKAVGSLAGTVVPQFVSDLAAELDKYQRKPRGITEYVKQRVPGVRQTLPRTGRRETNKLFDPTNSQPSR